MRKVRIAVVGAGGRMGQAIIRLALAAKGETEFEIACAIAPHGSAADDRIASSREMSAMVDCGADVAIDFSSSQGTLELASIAADARIAIVSGTTALSDASKDALEHASAKVPVLWEPNMSVGVHVLGVLVEQAKAMLGAAFDIEIVEAHHKRKLDAPSGTAKRLAECAALGDPTRIHSLRGGDVVGEHSVLFLGESERIELTHRAHSRDLFAQGALRAAAWIVGKPAARYRLSHLFGSLEREVKI